MSEEFDDAFISYAHLDNIELIEGRKGWVANLYRALDVRLAQLIGSDAKVWWDPKLQGSDYFSDTIMEKLGRTGALIAVLSPSYINSEWTRRELDAFCHAAGQNVGIRIRDKSRLFKVLKTPVPLDKHPQELQALLGYEFFKEDPDSGRIRELDEIFGPDAQRDFWLKLDDLAHDIASTLQLLYEQLGHSDDTKPATEVAGSNAVYLATTTTDLREERESLRRELEQRGYPVLPNRPLALAVDEVEAQIREDLQRCRMSIHLVGATYSLVPQGGRSSLIEMQYDLAVERAAGGSFSQLVWIPPGLEVADERQRQVLEAFRMGLRVHAGADLLETPLEDLRTEIKTWLTGSPTPATPARVVPDAGCAPSAPQLYLIYDQRDSGAIGPWAEYLCSRFEVIHPAFEGDEAEVREYHEENLKTCQGALIFYGAANEVWLRRKMREIQKSAGYGRLGRAPVVGVCLIGQRTPEKERFRTHEAICLEQWSGLAPDGLQPFITRLTPDADADGNDGAKVPA